MIMYENSTFNFKMPIDDDGVMLTQNLSNPNDFTIELNAIDTR